MPSRSLNQIKNSINSFEYDDEILIVMDFGMVSEASISADIVDGTLIVSQTNPNQSDQDIEISLPDEFTAPTVSINNGVITVTQSLVDDSVKTSETETDENEVTDNDE